jgi:hypothetical protein
MNMILSQLRLKKNRPRFSVQHVAHFTVRDVVNW